MEKAVEDLDQAQAKAELARLAQVLATRAIRCELGLDRHRR